MRVSMNVPVCSVQVPVCSVYNVCLSACLHVMHMSACVHIGLCACPSVCICPCICICLPLMLFACLSACLAVCLLVCLSVCVFKCLTIHFNGEMIKLWKHHSAALLQVLEKNVCVFFVRLTLQHLSAFVSF